MRFIAETEAGALRAHLDQTLEGPFLTVTCGLPCTSVRRPLRSARMGIQLSFQD
jgi:hypothetical protein